MFGHAIFRIAALVAALLATLAGCAAPAPSVPPSQSVPPVQLGQDPPTASASEHGFVLELWVDPLEANVGDRVFALVRVTNAGPEAPLWETNTCGVGPAPITVFADNGVEPGRAWDGNAAAFKRAAMETLGLVAGGASLVGEFTEADMIDRGAFCTAQSMQRPFAPGQVAEERLAWDITPREGVPITAGEATLTSTFTSGAGQVTARASIQIGGEEQGMNVVAFIDAALTEPNFRAWLERHQPGAAIDANIAYWPNSEGAYPAMPPYVGVRSAVVEVGAFYTDDSADGFFGAVVIDRATMEIIGTRFE